MNNLIKNISIIISKALKITLVKKRSVFMKNTKNLLITGVALAITLFASVQISAMELNKSVNPYLSNKQKHDLELAVAAAAQGIQLFSQGQGAASESLRNKVVFNQKIQSEKQRVERIKEIYYGNRAYTDNEISNIIYPSI